MQGQSQRHARRRRNRTFGKLNPVGQGDSIMSGLVEQLPEEPQPLVPVPQQDLVPNMAIQSHSDYAIAAANRGLPDPPTMHRSFYAKMLSMVTDYTPAQRLAQFPMVQRFTSGLTPGTSGLPYVLDTSLNDQTLCVYKPFKPDGVDYFDPAYYPVYFIFSGTATAWTALQAAILTATGSNYNTHFDPFKVAIQTYMTANAALFPTTRPIQLLGFSMGGTAAIWAQTVLSELLPNHKIYAEVFNPYVGHLTLASDTGKRGRDTDALNEWHQDRLQYLQSHSITSDHYVHRVTSNCIKDEDGSKYWWDFSEFSNPLWWGRLTMFRPLFPSTGVSLSFPLTELHTIKQWTGQNPGVPITTDSGPETIETATVDILAGVYKISGHALQQLTDSHGTLIHTSMVLTAQVDPAAPNTPIQYPTTQFMDDVQYTVAQYSALGQTFGIVPTNVDLDEYTIYLAGDPTVMQALECWIKPVDGEIDIYTIQRRTDGAYMCTSEIGVAGSYTLADKGPVGWEPTASYAADSSYSNLLYLGVVWKFSPMALADNDPTHHRGTRRAIQPTLYDILPQDGTVEKYVIKYDDMSHSYGGGAVSPVSFYLTQLQAGPLAGIDLHTLKPNTWYQTPAPIIDANIEISGDESLWTMKSRYGTNPTDYIVEIHSTVATQYSRDFAPDVTSAQLTNVAAPFDKPTPAAATICQLTDFEYLSNAYSFKAKLRVMNLPVASSYLVFAESGSSDPTTNGFYGSFSYGTQANATVLKFIKTTQTLTIS